MKTPDLIFARKEWADNSAGCGGTFSTSPFMGVEQYHHDRIVQSLRRENEELQAKLDANTKLMDESADKLIKSNAEITQAFEMMKAKLDKANNALDVAEWALLLVNNVRTVQYADQKHIKDALETIKFAKAMRDQLLKEVV